MGYKIVAWHSRSICKNSLYNCRGCLLQQVSRDPSAQSEPRGPRRAEVISEIALGDVLGSGRNVGNIRSAGDYKIWCNHRAAKSRLSSPKANEILGTSGNGQRTQRVSRTAYHTGG